MVAVDQRHKAEASEALAKGERAKAEGQKIRAEAREAQAIDAVKRFRDAVANEPELKNSPRLEGLRKRLLKEPLTFFKDLRDRLQADHDTQTRSLARLAAATLELGDLTNEIGDMQDAVNAYRESIAIQQKLVQADPTVTEYQRDLGNCQIKLARTLGLTGAARRFARRVRSRGGNLSEADRRENSGRRRVPQSPGLHQYLPQHGPGRLWAGVRNARRRYVRLWRTIRGWTTRGVPTLRSSRTWQ